MVTITGGDKLEAKLRELARKIAKGGAVKAGFLAGATYDDGTSVPMIAAVHEFGGKVCVEPRDQTIYRRVNKDGSFANNGQFVKASSSNFASDHYVSAHVINIPARPFMRPAVANNAGDWGDALAISLKATDYDAAVSLGRVGAVMVGDIQKAINDVTSPPLAPSTIRKKSAGGVSRVAGAMGPEKPLIDTGYMWASVASMVEE